MPLSFKKKLELLKILPHYYAYPNQYFKTFLEEFEEKTNVFGIKDNDKLELLPALLHGSASGKMQHLEQKSSKPAKQWKETCDQLIILMEKVRRAETSKMVMKQHKQSVETVMEYANIMETMSKEANIFGEQCNEMVEEELIKDFIHGLQYNIKKVIRRQKFISFVTLVKEACDEEQRQQQTDETTSQFNNMSLHSGQQDGIGYDGNNFQQRKMVQQNRGGFNNRNGGNFGERCQSNWTCKCSFYNFGFRKSCHFCKISRADGISTSNGNKKGYRNAYGKTSYSKEKQQLKRGKNTNDHRNKIGAKSNRSTKTALKKSNQSLPAYYMD